MKFYQIFIVFTFCLQINIYSQEKNNINNNIEYFTFLFQLKDSVSTLPYQLKLPGVFKNFSSSFETGLFSFEKTFYLTNNTFDYTLVIEGGFHDQGMILLNDQFLNNTIYRSKNRIEVKLPAEFLIKGINKISFLIVSHSEYGTFENDIYLVNDHDKVFLNGIWDVISFQKNKNNFVRKPTQGFDLLQFVDLKTEKYSSISYNDENWPKTNFPVSIEKLFDDMELDGVFCFRKKIVLDQIPKENYTLTIPKGIDDFDQFYVNGKLVATTDCFYCERKYVIPKEYLSIENNFTFFLIDKHGPGGVADKVSLYNTLDSVDISGEWSYKKLMEMQMLVTVKNVDNSKSFFKKSNFSFLNLDGDELIFENLLIEDVDGSNYLIFIISLFLLLLVLLYLFLRNRTTKKPIQKEELKEEIKHLFIRSDRADHKVLFSEILLIEGKKDYVKVSLLNKSYLVRKNLKTFLSELPESKFVRISKSVALNTEQIEKIDKNMLFVKSGNYYIIGKKYNQAIKELLK
jgi:hypothetical protein